jgi:hypothetical protein
LTPGVRNIRFGRNAFDVSHWRELPAAQANGYAGIMALRK